MIKLDNSNFPLGKALSILTPLSYEPKYVNALSSFYFISVSKAYKARSVYFVLFALYSPRYAMIHCEWE